GVAVAAAGGRFGDAHLGGGGSAAAGLGWVPVDGGVGGGHVAVVGFRGLIGCGEFPACAGCGSGCVGRAGDEWVAAGGRSGAHYGRYEAGGGGARWVAW